MLAMKTLDFGTPERVEWHLQNWREWMQSGSEVESLPAKAHGGMGRTFGSRDFDDMVEDEDVRCARVVDAIIGDLPPVQQAALAHLYLAAVFRFWRTDPHREAEAAKRSIGRELAGRGVW